MSKDSQILEGIVLRQIEYKDNDVIINVFSNKGKLNSFYARGIKKTTSKNANALQAFCQSEIEYFKKDKGLHTLKRANLVKNYFNDFKDYNKIIIAFVLLDVINDVSALNINNNPQLYQLLLTCLNAINDIDENLILAYFLIKIMQNQGIVLVVDCCAHCLSTKVNYISIVDGGFMCHTCLDNNNINNIYNDIELMKLFRIINKIELKDLDKLDFDKKSYHKLLEVIYLFYNNYTGLRIKNFDKLTLA